jgi:hypothetical protein
VKGEHLMSAKKTRPFSEKHDPDLRPDPGIEKALRKRGAKMEMPCALAFEIAEDLQVKPMEVGRTADLMNIKVVKCQLGLFGYKPEKKIVKAEETSNRALQDAVTGSSENNRLTCEKVWQIGAQFKTGRLTVSNVCQASSIQIKSCQLGAF